MDNLTALRTELFATLRGLRDKTIDIDTARAVNDVAKTLVDTAKVEVDFARATGGEASQFMAPPAVEGDAAAAGPGNGIVSIRRHVLQG
jgi:hypothetical protein